MLQRVQLRIPIDLSSNGIGKQLLVVHTGDDARKATLRFADTLKDMGVSLKETGLQSIADRYRNHPFTFVLLQAAA